MAWRQLNGQARILAVMAEEPVKEILRFAPSPTGYLHVGNARTALFSWLWARHTGGEFHLRIEDTDQARLVADAEDQIKAALEWLGLSWDGSVVKQSERVERGVYGEYAKQLSADGRAYESDGAIRFKWPDSPPVMKVAYFESEKRRLEREFDKSSAPSAFEDFVLIKADGFPTYNFAHIVDDHELGVTRVIRGDEFTSSLNKYAALCEAFGWNQPKYNHVPQILGPDKSKLSKRHGAKDVLEYRDDGYLPEALANFIALIGWSPGGNRELFFTPDELTEAFNLDGIQPSPGVFDDDKLRWLNKEHMKQRDAGDLMQVAVAGGFWKPLKDGGEARLFQLAAERASTLAEIKLDEYFTKRPKVSKEHLVGSENPETVGVWLERTQRHLDDVTDWNADRLKGALSDLCNELDLVPKQLYPVLRVAVTGADQTPALWDLFEVFGKEETLTRLEQAASLVA